MCCNSIDNFHNCSIENGDCDDKNRRDILSESDIDKLIEQYKNNPLSVDEEIREAAEKRAREALNNE